MALKGDLSTIGLAEVFQMISMSQKQGTLVVQDTDSRKCIYFGETGVKLLSTGKRKGLRLGDMLVRAGKLSDMALQDALENAKIQKKLLGEILVESGAVTDQEIQDVVRSQIEEEIYDLFVWKKAAFEFIEGAPSDALRDPEAPVTQLSFDVNGLLLEAVRRADEWNIIIQKIPSFDSIFTFVSESDRVEEDKTAPDQLKRVYRLVDGQSSISDIVEGTGISRFEVCKGLLELVDRGRVRLLTVHEVMDLAVKRMGEGHKDKALRLYQAAAAQAPKDPKVVVGVAKILDGEGLAKEAAANYARAGRLFLEQGDGGRALEHLQKAQSLNPDDGEVRLALFEAYAAMGDLASGKKMAQELISQAMMAPDYPRARMLCDRILSADPADLGFRVQRAKILHRTNQRKDLEEELALIRKNMPADPAAAEKVMRDLKEIMGPPSGVKRPTAAKKAPTVVVRKGRWKAWCALILLLLLAAAGFAVKYELDARKDLESRAEASRLLADQSKFAEARRVLEEYIGGFYRHSPMQKEKVQALLNQLDERQRTWSANEEARKAKDREEARARLNALWEEFKGHKGVSISKALEKLAAIMEMADAKGFPEDAQQAAAEDKALRGRAREADELRRKGDKLEEEGKFREAAMTFDRVRREYSNSDAAVGIQYPLGIATRPKGVTVTNVRAGRELGKTGEAPLKIRMREGETVRLRFQKEGFKEQFYDVADKTMGMLKMDLQEKLDLWIFPLGVRIEHEPLLAGDLLYLAVSNKVYALAARPEKEMVWAIPESLEGNIEGGLRTANGLLYAGTSAGWVYGLDPAREQGKRVLWKYPAGDRVVGAVGVSPDGGTVYACTAGRMLHAVGAKDGQPLWKKDLPAEAGAGPAFLTGAVLVACQNGLMLAFKGGGPSDELWRYQAGGQLGPMLVDKGVIFAAAGDQQVHAVQADGKGLWKRPVAGVSLVRPARLADVLYVPSREGKVVFLSAASGEVLGRFEAEGGIHGGVTVGGSAVYFGSDDGYLYAFDPSEKEMLWRCKSKGAIKVAPVLGGGRGYFAAGEVVYAVTLD